MRRAFKFLLTGRKYQLGDLVPAGGSGSGLLRWVLAGSKTPRHDASKGERLRLALQELGPFLFLLGGRQIRIVIRGHFTLLVLVLVLGVEPLLLRLTSGCPFLLFGVIR